jgi:hypothetical protein
MTMTDLPPLELTAEPELIRTSEGETIDPYATAPDPLPELEAGDAEAEVISRRTQKTRTRTRPVTAVSVGDGADDSRKKRTRSRGRGQPNTDEWTDFFAQYALDWLMGGYIWLMFRGIERDSLPKDFWDSLEAEDEDILAIAEALAGLTHGTYVSRKYGRRIVSSAQLADAVHALVMWGISVNRAATRVRRAQGISYPPLVTRKETKTHEHRTRTAPTRNRPDSRAEPEPEPESERDPGYPRPVAIFNPGGA